jgi:hypothetical protein
MQIPKIHKTTITGLAAVAYGVVGMAMGWIDQSTGMEFILGGLAAVFGRDAISKASGGAK